MRIAHYNTFADGGAAVLMLRLLDVLWIKGRMPSSEQNLCQGRKH